MYVNYITELNKIGQLHGHICFGLAVGYRAALMARHEFRIASAKSEQRIFSIIQRSNCCEEAIQLVTDCSWHKGTIIYQNIGRYVFICYNHTIGKSLRICLKQNLAQSGEELHDIKIKKAVVTEDENNHFWKLNKLLVDRTLQTDSDNLFDIQRYSMTLLVKMDDGNSLYVPNQNNLNPNNLGFNLSQGLPC